MCGLVGRLQRCGRPSIAEGGAPPRPVAPAPGAVPAGVLAQSDPRALADLGVRLVLLDRLPVKRGRQPVLLMDGKLGIGGDPRRLLHRCRGLSAPTGRLVIETEAHDVAERCTARLEDRSTADHFGPSRRGTVVTNDEDGVSRLQHDQARSGTFGPGHRGRKLLRV